MNRIKSLFEQDKAKIAFITAGDGGLEKSFEVAMALIEGGVNLLEIGVPFSDPIADGPVIQRASMRALQHGTSLQDVLQLVTRIRLHTNIPLILFSYFNPILSVLGSSFIADAKQSGIDGILIVDCPFEEMSDFREQCLAHSIAPIYVITPSTSNNRIRKINQHAKGFLYYACRAGTTGVRDTLPIDLIEKIKLIKSISTLPVVVGFGIANSEMSQCVLEHADGVVVGSRIVQAMEENKQAHELKCLAQTIFAR